MSETTPAPTSDEVTVRSAATVACVRDGATGPEVVLLRRATGHSFCPGAHVFPGGSVDAEDYVLAEQLVGEQTRTTAIVEDHAGRLAAIREAFEEAGLLVGLYPSRPLQSSELTNARKQLNTGRQRWSAVCTELALCPAPEQLVSIGFRKTPPGWPRRYATRFFLARADERAEPACDGAETDAAHWWPPQQALNEADADRIELVRPTRVALARLARYPNVARLFTALSDENGSISGETGDDG